MQKITLSFKSFNYLFIKNSYQHICQIAHLWEIPVHALKFTNLPTLRKRCTLLKSPHVHKKSREQFEWSRKKAQIIVHIKTKLHCILFLFLLKNSQFPGVELKITLSSSSSLPGVVKHLAKK